VCLIQWYEVKRKQKKNMKEKAIKTEADREKRQHQLKPCPGRFSKQGQFVRADEHPLNPPAGYTGGCPSAV